MSYTSYLVHGGPGSGRYPLGSGERPYQKFERSRKGRGGISGYIRRRNEKKAEEEKQKRAADIKQRQMQAEEAKRFHEADKERVLKSGTATEVMKYKGELTNKELKDAIDRIDYERKLSEMSEKELKTLMSQADKAMNNLKLINNWGRIGTETWNLMASIYNTTEEGKKKPWPIIDKPK